MKAAFAVLAVLSLGACATTPVTDVFDPAATSFTGYVRITDGEFQLYSREADVRRPLAQPCVSGALPRDAQRAAGDLGRQKVTFTGRAVAWTGGVGMDHQGSVIRNTCGGDHVILAEDVSVVR